MNEAKTQARAAHRLSGSGRVFILSLLGSILMMLLL